VFKYTKASRTRIFVEEEVATYDVKKKQLDIHMKILMFMCLTMLRHEENIAEDQHWLAGDR